MGISCMSQGTQTGALYQLEGWDAEGDGRKVQEGGDICIMKYYSAIKRNTFESVLMRWMKLEPIIQSEVSQKEK